MKTRFFSFIFHSLQQFVFTSYATAVKGQGAHGSMCIFKERYNPHAPFIERKQTKFHNDLYVPNA